MPLHIASVLLYLAHARYLVGAITHASSIDPASVNMRGFFMMVPRNSPC